MRPKVLFLDSVHPKCAEILQHSGFECLINYNLTDEDLKQQLLEVDAVVVRSRFRLTREILINTKKLKCIARAGAGMENIDVDFAEKMGISCVHAPEGNSDAVAEHVVGMLLMLFNNLGRADQQVRRGIWLREKNRGIELKGKKVGIVGYGNMGKALAQRLVGFGVEILVYDKYLTGFQTEKVKECSMQELFDECDVVSLHVPYNAETNYLVSSQWIKSFKKPFYLVNTSRGKCLKTLDLIDALESGKVLGACLDVLEFEAVSFENIDYENLPIEFKKLASSEKVVLSPHIAGWTHESNVKIATILANKIIQVFY